ncbi:DUF6263 family protein [Mucilaginibacter segetis]|uniref:Uncharacterized protein n=1 Tax=Mucilaginibacter segetis TaxID=2793071 RepID=A0A934PRM1_9SPHI|nr:DUF6263 family protein [Mucilaginibacter segetis]MBK0378177.1 hypothetical protein [Mucilaginibacter segetis]
MKNIFTSLLLLVSTTFCYSQKTKLKLDLKMDSVYVLNNTVDMTIDQEINGTNQIVSTKISAQTIHKVVAINDTLYTLEVKYTDMRMNMKIGDKEIKYSSTDKDGNPFAIVLAAMLNKPFTIIMSNTGRIIDVKNTDNLFSTMFDLQAQLTEAQKASIKSQMQKSFGEKTIKGNFQEEFVVFPEKKISLHDSWLTAIAMETSGVSINTQITYSLEDITPNEYVINGSAKIVSGKDSGYKVSNGLEMRFINMAGTMTAKVKIDKHTGWITESTITKHLSGTADIKDSPQIPGGLSYPITIDATLKATDK